MKNTLKIFFEHLNYKKIDIDESEFILQFNAHPNFPSALALSDTLSFFNVKNSFFIIEKSELKSIDNISFLSFIDDALVEVKKKKTTYKINGNIKEEKEFFSIWNGIIIDVDHTADEAKKKI